MTVSAISEIQIFEDYPFYAHKKEIFEIIYSMHFA
jgi:hypothetical protein